MRFLLTIPRFFKKTPHQQIDSFRVDRNFYKVGDKWKWLENFQEKLLIEKRYAKRLRRKLPWDHTSDEAQEERKKRKEFFKKKEWFTTLKIR